MLLQHTAGAHGAQWRHLFERREIDRFRLIAYDLPFHGKSLPPVGPKWWAQEYRLTASFARALPVTSARTLGLHRPVFMGCFGRRTARPRPGAAPSRPLQCRDLPGRCPQDRGCDQRSRTSLASAGEQRIQRTADERADEPDLARGLSQGDQPGSRPGWPPAFLGDLHYYVADYDLRKEASKIDTGRVAVHILSGEYDASGTMERGQAAQAAIAGSTWTGMTDVGHFPMSEIPRLSSATCRPSWSRSAGSTAARDEPDRRRQTPQPTAPGRP